MTMFIKIENGAPVGNAVSEENLRWLFPDLPKVFIPENIAPYGFGIYEFTQVPTPPKYLKLTEGVASLRENGIYYQNWQFVPMGDEERATADTEQEKMIRHMRYLELTRCDWTQLPDAPITEEQRSTWAVYRQQLRDISAQTGFPWEVTWPVAPV